MIDTLRDLEKDAEVLVLLDKWQERVFGVIPQETILGTFCDQEATRGIVALQYLEVSDSIYKRIYLRRKESPFFFYIGYYGGLAYNSRAFRTTTESLLIGSCVHCQDFDYLTSFVDRTDHFSKYMGILKRHPEVAADWLTLDGLKKADYWLCRYVAQRYLEGFTQTNKESVC